MNTGHHYRAFYAATAWTLGLLFLGSVVHATESSLACPDWPTCFGTMVPEMTGGVFWEHLHRLVAGGLVLIFITATYVAWKPEARRPLIRRWALAGIGLLLVQSLFGGLTVLLRLPDAVSTTHLALAFLFLSLTTGLTVVSSPRWSSGSGAEAPLRKLRTLAMSGAVLTFLQSVLGGAVRHMDAGLVCPDVPLCLGQWVPPLQTPTVAVHFGHRVTGVLLLITLLVLAVRAIRTLAPSTARALAVSAGALGTVQVLLGFLSVYTRLAVLPVSFHTLVAAAILTCTVGLAVMTWAPGDRSEKQTSSSALGVAVDGDLRRSVGAEAFDGS
jgi:heme A synthase